MCLQQPITLVIYLFFLIAIVKGQEVVVAVDINYHWKNEYKLGLPYCKRTPCSLIIFGIGGPLKDFVDF